MKFLWIAIFGAVLLMAGVTVDGGPAKGKIRPQTCSNECPTNYVPICAADINDSSSSPRLFGNRCILSIYNCENNSNLVEVDESKCKKAGGIRLL